VCALDILPRSLKSSARTVKLTLGGVKAPAGILQPLVYLLHLAPHLAQTILRVSYVRLSTPKSLMKVSHLWREILNIAPGGLQAGRRVL
jgi:hypothetical protein